MSIANHLASRQGRKKATNLSISEDVLADARQLKINVSQVCDAHLRELVRLEKERLWKAENAAFIEGHNKDIEKNGMPLAAWRIF